jgi:hypothetical protein
MLGGYAEGCRRRSPALRRGLLYAEGGRRRSMAYVERRYADGSPRHSLLAFFLGSTPTITLGVALFLNLYKIVKIITNSYDVRKMHIRYQNFQENILNPFISKSCISE